MGLFTRKGRLSLYLGSLTKNPSPSLPAFEHTTDTRSCIQFSDSPVLDSLSVDHTSDSLFDVGNTNTTSRRSSTMLKLFGSTSKRRSSRGNSESSRRITKPDELYGGKASISSRPSQSAMSVTDATASRASIATATGASESTLPAVAPAPSGPRPSELFAGKGVQWNDIDLTSRDSSTTTAKPASNEELQHFLKACVSPALHPVPLLSSH